MPSDVPSACNYISSLSSISLLLHIADNHLLHSSTVWIRITAKITPLGITASYLLHVALIRLSSN